MRDASAGTVEPNWHRPPGCRVCARHESAKLLTQQELAKPLG